MVEIARALSYDSRILVMDEPTAALTVAETDALFGMIRDFITPETGLIYISHRMPEIEEITDRVSVLRDGQYIGTVVTKEVEIREIISMMVGREVSGDARPRTKPVSRRGGPQGRRPQHQEACCGTSASSSARARCSASPA